MGLTRDRVAIEESTLEENKSHNGLSCASPTIIDFRELLNLLSEAHKLLWDIEDKIKLRSK